MADNPTIPVRRRPVRGYTESPWPPNFLAFRCSRCAFTSGTDC